MSAQLEDPRPSTPSSTVLSYEVNTTAIVTGLPPYEQDQMLRAYRKTFHEEAAQATCQVAHNSYDLSCQFYKNLHAIQADFDTPEDSIFESDDEDMPPLLPATPSTGENSPAADSFANAEVASAVPPSLPEDFNPPWATARNQYWASLGLGLSSISSPVPVATPAVGNMPQAEGFVPASQIWGAGRGWNTEASVEQASTAPEPALTPGIVLTNPNVGYTDGERIERTWANFKTAPESREMGPGSRRSALEGDGGTADIHIFRILSLHGGVRDIECDCMDGQHAAFSWRTAYAFRDNDGNVVVKKSQTLLLPMN
ncbi:hypothetical protein B0H13DRAFT_2378047 [Mycena leptocephala]|nr:hypothetical protein B0H13DRAFT_2378047 [Mycena leptocephala]